MRKILWLLYVRTKSIIIHSIEYSLSKKKACETVNVANRMTSPKFISTLSSYGNKTLIEDGVLARIDIYNSTVVTISLYEIVRGQTDNRSDITNGLTDHFSIPPKNYQHYNYPHIILQVSPYF